MPFTTARAFVRRCRRLFLIVTTIVGETLYLNLTIRRLPEEQRLRYRAERQSAACRRVMRIWSIKMRTVGNELPSGASVIASNHLGAADAFAVSACFPVAISGKEELLRIPVIGWVGRSIAMIPVHRERRLLTADFAYAVAARLDAGVNVLVFPEGTTVRGTEVMPFKTGGFAAIEGKADRNALPITLVVAEVDGEPANTRTHAFFTWTDPEESLFRHLWKLLGIGSARVNIVVGDRVPAVHLTRKDLADRCHKQIAATSRDYGFDAGTTERGKPAMSGTS